MGILFSGGGVKQEYRDPAYPAAQYAAWKTKDEHVCGRKSFYS